MGSVRSRSLLIVFSGLVVILSTFVLPSLATNDAVRLFPEDKFLQEAIGPEKIFPEKEQEYSGMITGGTAEKLLQSYGGKCTKSTPEQCPAPSLLKADGKVTRGQFLEALYKSVYATEIAGIQKKYPALTGGELFVREAWTYGLIDTYNASDFITGREAVTILYRDGLMRGLKKQGITKYFPALVKDKSLIRKEYFQDQEYILSLITDLDKRIAEQKKPEILNYLGELKNAYEEVYFEVVQNDKTYQLRPFGTPVDASYGEDVVMSYGFKDKRYPGHTGIDIAPYYGKKKELGDIPVVARQSGLAIFLELKNQKGAYGKSMGGYGNHVVILSEEFFRKVEGDTSLARHKQVYATLYGHMKSFGDYDPVENPIEYNGLIERFYNSKQVSFRDVKIVGVRTVTVGEVIGVMGSTGRSTGEHLHYEVRAMRDPLGKVEYMNPEAFQVKVPQYDYVYGTPHLGMGGGE